MKTLEFVKQDIKNSCEALANNYNINIYELNFGEVVGIYFKNNVLEFEFNGYVIYDDNLAEKDNICAQFTCAYKTFKGYISSKKLPIQIKDTNNVTLEEAKELLKFNTDAVKNTFDPFYQENQAKRKNAAAWNYISKNWISKEDTF